MSIRKYTGLSAHRYGDLFMNLAAWRTVKRIDPNSHITFLLNGNYRDAAPLFLDQPDIDKVHITHSPVGDFDEEDIKWACEQGFYIVYSLMADHDHANPWFFYRNQPQEVCHMHRLPILDDGKLTLNRWFEPTKGLEKYVALQAFAGSYDLNNKKALTIQRAQEIVELIRARGYSVLQLGLPSEPKLENTTRIDTDFFGAVKNMLGCKALVSCDSGFRWASSCYDFPTLGLDSNEYYDMRPHGGRNHIDAIQPLNPNATYLDEKNVNDISAESIDRALSSLL